MMEREDVCRAAPKPSQPPNDFVIPVGVPPVACFFFSISLSPFHRLLLRGLVKCWVVQSRFWMTLSTEGTAPIPRDSHVSVIHGQSMYVFGGSTGSAMNDFHELRLDKCRWNQVCVCVCVCVCYACCS